MNVTLLFIVGHLTSAIAYQYTNDQNFLLISGALIIYSLFQFVKVCSLVFSPNWDVELSYAEHIPISWKFLHSAAMSLSLYLIYLAGYEFLAGVATLHIVAITSALLVTALDPNVSEEDGEDEE